MYADVILLNYFHLIVCQGNYFPKTNEELHLVEYLYWPYSLLNNHNAIFICKNFDLIFLCVQIQWIL